MKEFFFLTYPFLVSDNFLAPFFFGLSENGHHQRVASFFHPGEENPQGEIIEAFRCLQGAYRKEGEEHLQGLEVTGKEEWLQTENE